METYCRLCAAKSDSFVKIYEQEGKELKLASKITHCLKIWLLPGDPLPKEVCQLCVEKLNASFQFMVTSAKAQVMLQAIFAPDMKVPSDPSVDSVKVEPDLVAEVGACDPSGTSQPPEVLSSEQTFHVLEQPSGQLSDRPEDLLECLLNNTDSANGPSDQLAASRRKGRTPQRRTSVISPSDWLDGESSSEPEQEPSKRGKKRGPKPGSKKKVECSDDERDESGKSKALLEGYTWYCVTCDNIFESAHELRTHYETEHQQSPIFKCMQCSKTYNRYRSFSRHVKLHRNPKKFSCEICGKTFAQKTILQSHSAVHSDERPYSCDQCGKCFKQFSSLYLHNKSHLPNGQREKFPCDHCDKEFATKHTLETHRKIHTGERNFVCDVCGKSFIAKGSLDYHILTHTGDKPHNCHMCGKAFKTARLLAKHVTLHSGIKPHQCDVCGKQFREKGALREHSRIHTGVMPYACDFCGKKFRFKGILTVHRRQHTGERPYVCLDCPRQFTNWANYNKHMKRRHRNVEGTEHTDPITGRRTFQSHAAAAAAAAAVTVSGAVTATSVLTPLCTTSLLASDTPSPAPDPQQVPIKPTSYVDCEDLQKQEEGGEEEGEETSDEEGENMHARTSVTESNSNGSMLNVSQGNFSTIYPPHAAPSKMAAMFQAHHTSKMPTVFYQDNMQESSMQAHNPYHMTYMSNLSGLHSGLSSGLPSGLSTGLSSSIPAGFPSSLQQSGLPLSGMSYYMPAIHHTEHRMEAHVIPTHSLQRQ